MHNNSLNNGYRMHHYLLFCMSVLFYLKQEDSQKPQTAHKILQCSLWQTTDFPAEMFIIYMLCGVLSQISSIIGRVLCCMFNTFTKNAL